jgi:hypothetical protein
MRGAVLACAWLALPSPGYAQARTALSWVRAPSAEGCIAAIELGRRVERIVGPVLTAASDGQISIEGRIEKRTDGFVASVLVSDAEGRVLGRRELQSADLDCRALDEQLAFVIAVAIDPDAALAALPGEFSEDTDPGSQLLAQLEREPAKPAPLGRRDRAATAQPAEPQAVRPSDPEASGPLTWTAAIGIAGAAGVLPEPTAGAQLELGLITGGFAHALRGAFWIGQRVPIDAGRAAELAAFELALATCPQLWRTANFAASLCGGALLSRLSVRPQGFVGSAGQSRLLLGPSLAARLGLRLGGPLWAVLAVSGFALWSRHRVFYERGGQEVELYRTPAISGSSAISIEVRF